MKETLFLLFVLQLMSSSIFLKIIKTPKFGLSPMPGSNMKIEPATDVKSNQL